MKAETYIATYPNSLKTAPELLSDPAFRESLCKQLHPTPPRELLPLVRLMFQQEVRYRTEKSHDHKYFENIYWTALFLYQIGECIDVLPMWQAKHIDMDTGAGFDIQFLVGRGVEETIKFLQQQRNLVADTISDYLVECRDAGDFDHLDEWLANRIDYFRED